MAVLPDYTSGTISLANGSTTVTGTGTLFDVGNFRAGDTLQIQNLTAVIASVDSNTQLTLAEPWTGTSLTDAPYRARYLPDGARVTAQTTTLIEMLGQGILPGIANMPNGVSGQVISVDITGSPVWVDNVGYAEGAWTPSLDFSGQTTGITYASQTGAWIRIGNFVFCKFRMGLSSKGTATGATSANMNGLPFPIRENSMGGILNIGYYAGMALPSPNMAGFLAMGTSVALRSQGTASTSQLNETNFTNTSLIIGGIAYEVEH